MTKRNPKPTSQEATKPKKLELHRSQESQKPQKQQVEQKTYQKGKPTKQNALRNKQKRVLVLKGSIYVLHLKTPSKIINYWPQNLLDSTWATVPLAICQLQCGWAPQTIYNPIAASLDLTSFLHLSTFSAFYLPNLHLNGAVSPDAVSSALRRFSTRGGSQPGTMVTMLTTPFWVEERQTDSTENEFTDCARLERTNKRLQYTVYIDSYRPYRFPYSYTHGNWWPGLVVHFAPHLPQPDSAGRCEAFKQWSYFPGMGGCWEPSHLDLFWASRFNHHGPLGILILSSLNIEV